MDETPLEVLESTICLSTVLSAVRPRKWRGRPGEMIERLPEDRRATLRRLRSSDVSADKVSRHAAWADYRMDPFEEQLSRLKREFDRKFFRR